MAKKLVMQGNDIAHYRRPFGCGRAAFVALLLLATRLSADSYSVQSRFNAARPIRSWRHPRVKYWHEPEAGSEVSILLRFLATHRELLAGAQDPRGQQRAFDWS